MRYAFIVAVGSLLVAASIPEQGVTRLWEVHLSGLIKEKRAPLGALFHQVNAIRFSPDERFLAISATDDMEEGKYVTHLLLVDLHARHDRRAMPETTRQFEIVNSEPEVAWSPDSKLIAINSFEGISIFHTADGVSGCTWQGSSGHTTLSGFIGNELVVTYELNGGKSLGPDVIQSGVVLLGPDCKEIRHWPVQGLGRIVSSELSESGGLLAFIATFGKPIVADAKTGTIVDTWDLPYRLYGIHFLEDGKAICVADGFGASPRSAPPRCHEVGGKEIEAKPKVRRGWPIATSGKGRLVAAVDVKSFQMFLSEHVNWTYEKTVIYDYLTGKTVATLPVSIQTRKSGVNHKDQFPFAFALSSSGKYFAEAGDDTLRLYEVQPSHP